jgi:N-acetylneuraminic acid mutarotase
VYGTKGQPAATNMPGARSAAVAWTDASGNFWLFGGFGYDSAGGIGVLGDLWEYSPSTGEWTWEGGSNTSGVAGVYGALGQPAATNVPGGRMSAVAWTDATGDLWLLGGAGADYTGNIGILNDLWKYTPSTGVWTWESGSETALSQALYGTLHQPAATNVPGGRMSAVAWADASGNFWLFGGYGYDSSAILLQPKQGWLNDLWKYTPSTGEWAWEGGSNTWGAAGVHGTLDQPAATNMPGARQSAVVWADTSGNVWLFGGDGDDSTGGAGVLNDLWWLQASSIHGCSGFGCP